jgi:Tfp pilus assembly protein FimT
MIRPSFRERVRRARLRQHRHRVRAAIIAFRTAAVIYLIALIHVVAGTMR